MKYINTYHEGDRVSDIYLCKYVQPAVTKNGKPFVNVILQDKTGTIDAKIWDPNNAGIADFDVFDYIEVFGDVNSFQGTLQVSVKRVRVCGEDEYHAEDYLPVSKRDRKEMLAEFHAIIKTIQNKYYKTLVEDIFIKDEAFAKAFSTSSAAKTVHHGFVGGLLEHTLNVTKLCVYYCEAYKHLNRDLLLSSAMLHDIGKVKELSLFPQNDYTDEGQFLGHIVMGSEMISDYAKKIPEFPELELMELKHCIIAHHGELEYGSPKKPALMEAVALNFADNTDAKMQIFTELLDQTEETGWLGYNRLFESNLRVTKVD
jgi:3'-5' exoribonuclease